MNVWSWTLPSMVSVLVNAVCQEPWLRSPAHAASNTSLRWWHLFVQAVERTHMPRGVPLYVANPC